MVLVERRKAPRIKLQAQALLSAADQPEETLPLNVEELSPTGILLCCDDIAMDQLFPKEPEDGTAPTVNYLVQFELPEGPHGTPSAFYLHCRKKSLRRRAQREFLLALQFLDMNSTDYQKIAKFVETNSPDALPDDHQETA